MMSRTYPNYDNTQYAGLFRRFHVLSHTPKDAITPSGMAVLSASPPALRAASGALHAGYWNAYGK